jgi:hypothetical protein
MSPRRTFRASRCSDRCSSPRPWSTTRRSRCTRRCARSRRPRPARNCRGSSRSSARLLQRLPRAPHARLRRHDCGLHDARHFVERPAVDRVEREGQAMNRIDSIELRVEASRGFARHRAIFGRRIVRRDLGYELELRRARLLSRDVRVRDADRAAIDPGTERGLAAEIFERTEDLEERLLDQIVDVRVRSQDAIEHRVHAAPLAFEELALRGALSRNASLRERQILRRAHRALRGRRVQRRRRAREARGERQLVHRSHSGRWRDRSCSNIRELRRNIVRGGASAIRGDDDPGARFV